MNDFQKRYVQAIVRGHESEFLGELLEHFLNRGLGSVSKTETDIYLFHLLDKYCRKKRRKMTNYEWSSLLKVSERKIKNLRLEQGIRYGTDEEDHNSSSWLGFIELITEGNLEVEKTDHVVLTVDDPFLLRFIEAKLKEFRLPGSDYSFNSERVRLKTKAVEKLVAAANAELGVLKGSSVAEQRLRQAKWTYYKSDAKQVLFDMLKNAIPGLILKT